MFTATPLELMSTGVFTNVQSVIVPQPYTSVGNRFIHYRGKQTTSGTVPWLFHRKILVFFFYENEVKCSKKCRFHMHSAKVGQFLWEIIVFSNKVGELW